MILAGAEIISREGLHKLSVRYAARKIGVSHAAPYRHFKNRDELLVAIVASGFDILSESIQSALVEESSLGSAASAYLEFASQNPAFYQVMFGGHIKDKSGHADFSHSYNRLFLRFAALVAEVRPAMARGEIQLTVMAIWSLLHGFASMQIDNGRSLDRPAIIRKLERLLD